MIGPIIFELIPIALVIGLGHAMRRRAFLADAFWAQAERLSYFVLLPALFAHSLATADLQGMPVGGLVKVLIISSLVIAALLVTFNRIIVQDGPAFTSVFQGGIRFNNYVGIAAAIGLFGTPALALVAVSNATIVPTVNVLCVLVFGPAAAAVFGSDERSPVPPQYANGQIYVLPAQPRTIGIRFSQTF